MDLIDIKRNEIYIDSNIFIYTIEWFEDYNDILRKFYNYISELEIYTCTSELTISECLVKPLKDKNIEAVNNYLSSIKNNNLLEVVPVSKDILLDAAKIRADIWWKLPDAIHWATAIKYNCKYFFTNDKKIKLPKELIPIFLCDLK